MNKDKWKISLLLLAVACMISFSCTFHAKASAGSVTGYQKITWGISTGRYYVNGIHAFCAQYNKSWPLVGTVVDEIVPCTNDVLRKALYYGYNGPQNTLGTDERAHVLTAIAVSNANIGEPATGASAKYDAFYWELVNNSAAYPSPPNNFKVYMAITASDEMQNLAFYEIEKNGYVRATKSSSDVSITNGNAFYSLEGAQYAIHSNSSLDDNSRVGILTTDAGGQSNTLELCAGTYYAYELVAPKGYIKSAEVTEFTVISENTTVLNFVDDPQVREVELIKYQTDTDIPIPNTVFEHISPNGSVEQLTTDENGKIILKRLCFGKHVFREVSATEGYVLNDTPIDVVVDENANDKIEIVLYNEPEPYELFVFKTDIYGNKLKGAEFAIYLDEECQNEFARGTTDEEGVLRIPNMEVGKTYFLKEIKAPAGYQIPGETENLYKIVGRIGEEKVNIEVINEVGYVLPKTGSSATIIMTLSGLSLCVIGLNNIKKENRKRR